MRDTIILSLSRSVQRGISLLLLGKYVIVYPGTHWSGVRVICFRCIERISTLRATGEAKERERAVIN